MDGDAELWRGRDRRRLGGEGAFLKYKVMAVIALLALAVLAIGDGYLRTRRAERSVSAMKSRVSGMSIQQLARAEADCDSWQPARAPMQRRDGEFCEEVARAIEAEPLQIVGPRAPK
jgi:hypothetical protein